MMVSDWPKKETTWIENKTLYISIPFTWNLPKIKERIRQRPLFNSWNTVVAGGPAIQLMPSFFEDLDFVEIGKTANGVMQKINPMATKTSVGCVRNCKFCAVPRTEGKLRELKNWPDLPIITDNNLLACSEKHFSKVIDRLKKFQEVDFNQGVDSRLLRKYHADRFAELKNPIIRLALDSMDYSDQWVKAFKALRGAGLPKRAIRSYAIIGFDSNVNEAWERCEFISSFGIKVLPMWFHELDALISNACTKKQIKLGWSDFERKMIMGYYYRHRFPKERRRYYLNKKTA